MDKIHKVADPRRSETPATHVSTNWDICVLCQTITSEILHCPADSKRGTDGKGYAKMAENITGFIEIGCLPKTVNISDLGDNGDINATFNRNKANFMIRADYV